MFWPFKKDRLNKVKDTNSTLKIKTQRKENHENQQHGQVLKEIKKIRNSWSETEKRLAVETR
jgi:hypothetical protein